MENNFEQHIRDMMNNPPEHPFEERLWQDMEGELDHATKPAIFSAVARNWPLLLFAFLMTALAGIFYVRQYKAMEKMQVLERQLQALHTPESDTVLEKHVTVIYDTIYNSITIDEPRETRRYSGNYLQFLLSGNGTFPERIIPVYGENLLGELVSKPFAGINYFRMPRLAEFKEKRPAQESGKPVLEKAVSELTAIMPDLSTMDALEWYYGGQRDDFPEVRMQKKRQKRNLTYFLHRLKPSKLLLSGTTGTFVSLNLGGNGFNLRGSAHADISLGKRSFWTMGIEYFSNDFTRRIEEDDEDPLKGFPELPPNNEGDVLRKIQGDFNYLQIPLGFKHVIFPKRYIYPYVGLGLIAGKTTRSRLEYEYVSSLGTYAVSEGKLVPRAFDLNAFWSSLGARVQLNKKWFLLLESSAQFDLKKGTYNYEDLKILKFSTGFQYRF